MTALALSLILVAAFIHASWNYLLKRSGGGVVFVWLFATLSAIIYAPIALAVLWWTRPALGWVAVALMLGSALLHTVYYTLLDRGYRSGGDLSLVYPLARGSAPLITVFVAIALLAEQPSGVALTGAFLVACAVILLTGRISHLRQRGNLLAVAYALLTGCMIASYTVVDKIAVAAFAVPPILQDWAANCGRVALMTPLALRRTDDIAITWRRTWKEVVGVAVLCPLSYILVLTAMVFTPVSYVAPAREVSILIAAAMGAQLLKEGEVTRRLLAAATMVAGIICLALG